MKIIRAGDVPDRLWDELCDNSPDAWLFHRSAWIAIETRYFDCRNLSFALQDGTRLIGIQPLYFSEVAIGWMERLIHSGIHRHTGLALLDGLSAATVQAAWSAALRQIGETARAEQADRIQLNTQNLAPANLGPNRDEIPRWVRECGFQLGLNFSDSGFVPVPGMTTCCADQIVHLAHDDRELWTRLNQSCQRAVRKAQKAELEFDAGNDDGLAEYWRLALLAAARTGQTLPPREYYEDIVRDLGATGQSRLLFARHNGRCVAALLLLIDKRAASYLGGVSDPDYLPMRVNDFLHWSAILWAKQTGLGWYRLGPAFPDLPQEWPIAQVARFKTKFGARWTTTIQGSQFLKPEKYLTAGIDQLTRLCTNKDATVRRG